MNYATLELRLKNTEKPLQSILKGLLAELR